MYFPFTYCLPRWKLSTPESRGKPLPGDVSSFLGVVRRTLVLPSLLDDPRGVHGVGCGDPDRIPGRSVSVSPHECVSCTSWWRGTEDRSKHFYSNPLSTSRFLVSFFWQSRVHWCKSHDIQTLRTKIVPQVLEPTFFLGLRNSSVLIGLKSQRKSILAPVGWCHRNRLGPRAGVSIKVLCSMVV